jgi:hypothetical protein
MRGRGDRSSFTGCAAIRLAGWRSVEGFDPDVTEGDGVVMAGEAEVAGGAVFARVGIVAHERGDFAEVGVEDGGAVQFHFDGGSFDGDLLEVPLAGGRW